MNPVSYTMDWCRKYYDINKQEWTFPVHNKLLDKIFEIRSSSHGRTSDEQLAICKKLATMMSNYDTEVALAGL